MEIIHRVFITCDIYSERIGKPIFVGEHILNDYDYKWMKNSYSEFVTDIPMNEQEWIDYLSIEVYKYHQLVTEINEYCKKINIKVELPVAFEDRTESLKEAAVRGKKLDPDLYGGGFQDMAAKAYSYIRDAKDYASQAIYKIKYLSSLQSEYDHTKK